MPKIKKPSLFKFERKDKESNPSISLNGGGVDVVISLMMLYELLPPEIQAEWLKIPSQLKIADTITSFQTGQHKPSSTLIFKDQHHG